MSDHITPQKQVPQPDGTTLVVFNLYLGTGRHPHPLVLRFDRGGYSVLDLWLGNDWTNLLSRDERTPCDALAAKRAG